MASLYVVTHPEATHSVRGVVGGWYDSDLTLTGHEQALHIAEALTGWISDGESLAVHSSDLRRTRQTAAPIARRFGVAVGVDQGLRERSYGAAEGNPIGRYVPIPPPLHGDRMGHEDGVDGSETTWDVASRVYAATERIIAHPQRHHVVVTHDGAATYVIAAWIGMPLASAGKVRFRLSAGSITVLAEDEVLNREVVLLNDVRHLRMSWTGQRSQHR